MHQSPDIEPQKQLKLAFSFGLMFLQKTNNMTNSGESFLTVAITQHNYSD